MIFDNNRFELAQDFFWYNDAKLPTPANWVNIKRIRVKDAVNTIWWLVKTADAYSDNRNVLERYKDGMQKLLATQQYNRGDRPSGHKISDRFTNDNGGSIPSNLLKASNTNSADSYLELCRNYNLSPHPARFPSTIPRFFISFLSKPNDLILDPFAGSNVTGRVAEGMQRRWIAIDRDFDYVRGSQLRFSSRLNDDPRRD